jgi:hypothetical protein
VLVVAGIAAYISYWHAYVVVRQYGESGVTALLEPGTIDGLVYASSMVILHAARHRLPVPSLARWMLALGIAASLAVNVAQGWSHGLVGAAAAAWPAVALVGSYEMLAWMIRTAAAGGPNHWPSADHSGAETGQPRTDNQPGVSLLHEGLNGADSGDGADSEARGAHVRVPPARVMAQVRGPGSGGPGGTDHADHRSGPGTESTGSRGPGMSAAPGPAIAKGSAGEVDAAAVAAYRASLRAGKPLSERKLAEAFGTTHAGGHAVGLPKRGRCPMLYEPRQPVCGPGGARPASRRHSMGVTRKEHPGKRPLLVVSRTVATHPRRCTRNPPFGAAEGRLTILFSGTQTRPFCVSVPPFRSSVVYVQ